MIQNYDLLLYYPIFSINTLSFQKVIPLLNERLLFWQNLSTFVPMLEDGKPFNNRNILIEAFLLILVLKNDQFILNTKGYTGYKRSCLPYIFLDISSVERGMTVYFSVWVLGRTFRTDKQESAHASFCL